MIKTIQNDFHDASTIAIPPYVEKKLIVMVYGLPNSGKTTLAEAIYNENHLSSIWLNADKVRSTLSKDLGFKEEDRIEQARRMACVASLALDGSSLTTAIVDFVNPTVSTFDTFHKNMSRPIGNRLIDDPARVHTDVKGSISYPMLPIYMNTIDVSESRFADTNKMFNPSSVENAIRIPRWTDPETVNLYAHRISCMMEDYFCGEVEIDEMVAEFNNAFPGN